ncbi:hypothetical protein CHS0354_034842, partial [Potamilus streckersoni]
MATDRNLHVDSKLMLCCFRNTIFGFVVDVSTCLTNKPTCNDSTAHRTILGHHLYAQEL